MENFVPSLLSLRNARPQELVVRLHQLFSVITTMDADEVVAAYQTVELTAQASGLTADPMILHLQKALLAQMKLLGAGIGGHYQHQRFKAVTGRPFGLLGW